MSYYITGTLGAIVASQTSYRRPSPGIKLPVIPSDLPREGDGSYRVNCGVATQDYVNYLNGKIAKTQKRIVCCKQQGGFKNQQVNCNGTQVTCFESLTSDYSKLLLEKKLASQTIAKCQPPVNHWSSVIIPGLKYYVGYYCFVDPVTGIVRYPVSYNPYFNDECSRKYNSHDRDW